MTRQSEEAVDAACRLHDEAVALREAGDLARAESTARRALRLMERAAGPAHPDVANLLVNLAHIREGRDALGPAERLLRRAVAILGAVRGGGEDVARLRVQALRGLGDNLRLQGRYREAEPILKKALARAERAL